LPLRHRIQTWRMHGSRATNRLCH